MEIQTREGLGANGLFGDLASQLKMQLYPDGSCTLHVPNPFTVRWTTRV
jgi:hypothetical protein